MQNLNGVNKKKTNPCQLLQPIPRIYIFRDYIDF